MKKLSLLFIIMSVGIITTPTTLTGCKKNPTDDNYNLNVKLFGNIKSSTRGFIAFRQSAAAPKIITLDTYLERLLPNHEYLLQRAVDPINVVDGNCTSSTWLTLGLGLTPQSILTDHKGNGHQKLWRDLSSLPSGSHFDIHFQVIDAASSAVVLSSNCYDYMLL